MARILTRCPVCEAALRVSELECVRCKTMIHGAFDTCRFCRLAPEHLAFVELFLRCEGNLSRVEKELSLSYPTVRNKLQAALTALGFSGNGEGAHRAAGGYDDPPDMPPPFSTAPGLERDVAAEAERRRELLDALARGDLSADDVAEALRDLF